MKLKTLLLEATNNLYHYTGAREIRDILKSNTIKLTYAGVTEAELEFQRGRPFYFSMAREKVGRYVRGSYSTDKLYPEKSYCIIELDGRLLGNNFKIIPVDYWEGGHTRSESEDRLISYKDRIPNANKYIKGIHVYIHEERIKKKEKWELQTIYEMNLEAKKKNIPLYYYTDPNAFMQLRTSKSVNIPDMLSVPQDFSDEDTSSRNNLMRRNPDWGQFGYYGEELLHMWLDKPAINQRKYDALVLLMTRYPWDLYVSISNDIHNSKGHHPSYLQDLVHTIRKSKSSGLKEFIFKVMNKIRKKEGHPQMDYKTYEKYAR